MNKLSIEEKIAAAGLKLSQGKKEILEILEKNAPISVPEILSSLKTKKISLNKTSIYRALSTLIKKKLVSEIDLGEGKKRYEASSKEDHHHHFLCNTCQHIYHIRLDEMLVSKIEKNIESKNKFSIENHKIEFYGKCGDCG
ncbi:MAG: Fur family transcriptional regulator, ferric uptake regulator [Parcubacteria group bacterium Gr01-1014_18]|nr:MAG: Fur family transcriptional regulator, ferric uptake regulator [Parcubacteria group bacterium Greene0416_36]TSC81336.1 MAG: Fur family transcriptional regulator, ferric uptake regulator [Parcubacteria group bacterium Gr01-1014_18]TSC99478.1 MAG: Fur family transcriptional regulator, ferric uptake regulator [Parcubacteria group bacterium Greene1014_20]TSD07603.1 MAG: Fur family transcriptional regulator, ferric uptake regulator [Parcubacteria group bacterium Greene0714_2]